MWKLIAAALPLALFASTIAEAAPRHKRPHHHAHVRKSTPTVKITLGTPRAAVKMGPWSVNYTPTPRPGWSWITGVYVRGVYHPGHWVPATTPPRADLIWVAGHWANDAYVDGYYRVQHKPDYIWVDGYYAADGIWIEGYWGPDAPPPPPPIYPQEQVYIAPIVPEADSRVDDYREVDPPPVPEVVDEYYYPSEPMTAPEDDRAAEDEGYHHRLDF